MPGIPGPPSLAPQEQDLHALLRRFLHKVDKGSPLFYATFREAWQDMHFSLVYEGCLEHSTLPGFMQSLFAVACDHLQAPLPPEPAEPAAPAADAAQAAEAPDNPLDQPQHPPSAEGTPAAATPQQTEAGSAEERHRLQPDQAASTSRRGKRPRLTRRPASSSDLLAAAVARSAAAGPRAQRGPARQARSDQPRQQPAALPRIDSAALRAMLLEDGDGAEQPPPSHAEAATEDGGLVDGAGVGPDHGHIERLVSTLQDLDVPDVEPEHPPEMPDAPSNPGQEAAAQQVVEAEKQTSSPSLALQVGALYAIYTLHETQPGAQKVRPYLPLSSLQIILDVVRETRRRGVPDAAAVLKRLVASNAIVCGAVLRPPAYAPASPVQQPKMAQVDMRARDAVIPLTLAHLQATHADLRELKHLQLLCDSYRSAQARVFAAADPDDLPPSIADLNMGQRLSNMLGDLALDVQSILDSGTGRQKPGKRLRKDGRSTGQDDMAQRGQERSALLPDEAAALEAAAVGVDLPELEGEDGEALDLSGLPAAARRVELKKARERAAMRRKQALWAARGAAALAAASDMPGSPPPAGPPPTTAGLLPATACPPTATEGPPLAADGAPQEWPGTVAGAWAASAAAEPSAVALMPGIPFRVRAARQEAATEHALQRAAVAEQLSEVASERTVRGAEEAREGMSDAEPGPGAWRRTKARRAARKARTGTAAEAAREENGVASKSRRAAASWTQPGRSREPLEETQHRAAAAGIGECGHGPGDLEDEEGVSVDVQDGMKSLEYDILGLPIIPDLGSGRKAAVSPVTEDGMQFSGADIGGFESDVSDKADDLGAAETIPTKDQRSSVLSDKAVQPLRKGQAAAGRDGAEPVTSCAAKGKRVAANTARAPGGNGAPSAAMGEHENGTVPVQKQPQLKGSREGPARGPPSKAGPAVPARKSGRGLSGSDKLCAGLEVVEEADRGLQLPQAQVDTPEHADRSSKKAASAAERRQAIGAASPQERAVQEMMLPPRKRAKAAVLTGSAAPDLNGFRGSTSVENQDAAQQHAHQEGGREGDSRGYVGLSAGKRQPDGPASVGNAGAAAHKGAPIDWAAYATDMARLAAQAEALLAEEDDDI